MKNVCVCDAVSGTKSLLDNGADPNLIIRKRDAAAIHLAAGVDSQSARYTTLLLRYSGNPNLPYVYRFF